MTRKWGFCSTTGTITLAADLYEQEPGFQDFVRVPTHGGRFNAMMTAHVPNWRAFNVARHRPRIREGSPTVTRN
jgi:hypothetical protein